MLIKVVAVQTQLGQKLTLDERLLIFKQKPDFICLPEYFLLDPYDFDFIRSASQVRDNLNYINELSIAFSSCVIGGSVVEAEGDSLFNASYLYNRGRCLGRYRKLNPVAGESSKGILPGDKIFITKVDGIKIAILICADALNIELFKILGEEKVDIIFIPTTSPHRPDESHLQKFNRDNEIYLKAAQTSSSFIIKTCAVGELFRKRLQGRSLIVSPWGILKRVDPIAERSPRILSEILNIDELRDFRKKKRIIAETLADLVKK
ncbi:MAG: carbon-nitrogen hydrolase family protein [Candidatus Zixiibacteriota bacterium]